MNIDLLLNMFISFTVEILVAGIMLTKKKLDFRFKRYISIPVGLLIAFGSTALTICGLKFYVLEKIGWNEWVNIIAYVIPTLGVYFAMLFAYDVSPLSLILTVSVAYSFQSMSYQMYCLIFETGLTGVLYNAWGNDTFIKVFPIVSKISEILIKIGVYVICYFAFARVYIKYAKHMLKIWRVAILGVAMFFITNIVNTYIVQHVFWDPKLRFVICLALIVFCIFFDEVVVGSFKIADGNQENTIIKATLNSKIRQKEMTEANIAFMNMKCHDLRKELRKLRDKKDNLNDEDFELLLSSLNFYDSSIDSGNVDIDALIQDKLIYCNSSGIEFTALVDGDAFKDIASSDMYFMLTNIIDNAIEAVENVESPENKVITLTASKKQGVLIIEQSNYFKGRLEFNHDGSIKTTKKNAKYHGYGTKSIAYIVKKYDGEMDIEVKDNIFKLKIAI